MDIPVVTYDVMLGDAVLLTVRDEALGATLLALLSRSVKDGRVIGVDPSTIIHIEPSQTKQTAASVAEARRRGFAIDDETLAAVYESVQKGKGGVVDPAPELVQP